MSNSVKVTIQKVLDEVKEQLIARLNVLDVDGFEELEEELICYYTEGKVDAKSVEEIINTFGVTFFTSTIPERNWNKSWEKSFSPVVIDNFCTIRAGFHQGGANTKFEIIITPKMSFGTGHHATTYLMVQQMATLDFGSKCVADFGTGTGVLAILAEKLGSRHIWAVDNDAWSIDNANENIRVNKCIRVALQKADHFQTDQKFDIILANINKNVIFENLGGLVFGLKEGGTLLLSGLLKEDEEAVIIRGLQNNLKHVRTVERDNWISILFTCGR